MSAAQKTVLLRGAETDLTGIAAAALLARGAAVAIDDTAHSERGAELSARLARTDHPGTVLDLPEAAPDPFAALRAQGRAVDAVVHLYLPDASTTAEDVLAYPARLRPMLAEAADAMRAAETPGIIINQFLMATLLADHPLAPSVVEARNAITGLTRVNCVRYGRHGIRITGLMVGLLDLPPLRALASERVNAATTPLGRWITPEEVVATLAFLALDSGYITGQMLVLDGGMTSGVNGV
jgi:hypothetical protein